MTQYVYTLTEPNLYTVGFYGPDENFHPDSDHVKQDDARARVHYLNGGRAVLDLQDPDSEIIEDLLGRKLNALIDEILMDALKES